MVDIICLSSWRGVGGAQMNAAMLAKEFEMRGYTAELGFLFDREPDVEFDAPTPFVVSKCTPKNIIEWFRFFFSLKINMFDKKPKVIFGFHPFSNVIGAFISLLSPDCIFIGTQRNPSESQSRSVSFLERIVGTMLYKANICVTQSVADSYHRYPQRYKSKIKVVHNGTPPLVDSTANKKSSRNYFHMNNEQFILGCLGRLHDQKNIKFAIDVIAGYPNATLYIAGTGPLEKQLKEKVNKLDLNERVIFLGPIHGQDITRFYNAIDVLLFPSLFEGFGRVLIEALSKGVLVLANDIPVIKEVASEAAILLPLEIDQWVSTLKTIDSDHSKLDDYNWQGVERSKLFTVEAMVTNYLNAAGLPEKNHE